MNIIVGLGNPGKEYEGTRHNVGRDLLLELVATPPEGFVVGDWKADKKLVAQVADFSYEGKAGKFILPDTFMNLSGKSVATFLKYSKEVENLIVIHDDLDLPIGRFKISFDRGSGGHKGVDSIMDTIGTKAFIRIKIGISPQIDNGEVVKPQGEKTVQNFVLGTLKTEEREVITSLKPQIIESLKVLLIDGPDVAMNRFN